MAHELNLKNRYLDCIHTPLSRLRGGPDTGGFDLSLSQHLEQAKIKGHGEQYLTVEGIWNDLGINPETTTLYNVMTLGDSPDLKYFAAEVIRDFLLLGMRVRPYYENLIMREGPAVGQHVVSPWIEYGGQHVPVVGEGETMPEVGYKWGIKRNTLPKFGESIYLSDELLWQVTLPILGDFLMRVGQEIKGKLNRHAVHTLIYGVDDPNVEDSCAVIGIGTPNTIDYADFTRAWARGDHIVFDWKTMVTTEVGTADILALREFKWREFAGALMTEVSDYDRITPARVSHFQTSELPDSQILLVDPNWAMTMENFMGLRVETDRLIHNQLNGTAVSMIAGFSTVDRRARIILDMSKAFSANGFPAWLTPLD